MVTQQEIVDLMKQGWELVYTSSWSESSRLQKGHESKKIRGSSIGSLLRKGMIEQAPRRPNESLSTKRYRLTGKSDKVSSEKRVLRSFVYTQSIRNREYGDVVFWTLARTLNEAVNKFMQVPLVEEYGSKYWVRERATQAGDQEGMTDPSLVYMLDDRTRKVLQTFKVK